MSGKLSDLRKQSTTLHGSSARIPSVSKRWAEVYTNTTFFAHVISPGCGGEPLLMEGIEKSFTNNPHIRGGQQITACQRNALANSSPFIPCKPPYPNGSCRSKHRHGCRCWRRLWWSSSVPVWCLYLAVEVASAVEAHCGLSVTVSATCGWMDESGLGKCPSSVVT